MYLSDSEEIVAFIVALVIVMGFVASTYMEIKNTIAEEKERIAEKHKNEEKWTNKKGDRRNKRGGKTKEQQNCPRGSQITQ